MLRQARLAARNVEPYNDVSLKAKIQDDLAPTFFIA
jgi:hypothetical protein